MSRFLKQLFWKDELQFKTQSPIMSAFSQEINFDYSPLELKTLFNLKLEFKLGAWVYGNQENQERIKNEVMRSVVKRLHYEIYGEIESLVHELKIHIINDDFDACKKTIEILEDIINE